MVRRFAVIGAGISGLACALRLQALDPESDVQVYERDSRAGGKILTEHVDGFVIEHGPDAFLASKPGAVQLAERLGLAEEMISPRPEHRGAFILNRGTLQPIPQGLSGLVPGDPRTMVRSSLISWPGRLRMAAEYLAPVRKSDEEESIQAFMVRRYGRETWERMIEPLLTGIYGGDGDRLSLDATFPNLRTQERTHGSLIKGAMAARREGASRGGPSSRAGFISFRRGMQSLVDAATAEIAAKGGTITYGTASRSVTQCAGGKFQVASRCDGIDLDDVFDGVVVAVPAWEGAGMLRDVAPVASAELASIEHGSSGLVSLAFPESQLTRPLNGYGYVIPRVEQRDATAMTWSSSKWAGRVPEGHALVRVFAGRVGRDRMLEADDSHLVQLALREMNDTLGLSIRPSLTRVQRWMRGMPQYTIGHLARVDRIQRDLGQAPGLELAGAMFRGVGIPDAILSGESAASNIVTDLNAAAAAQGQSSDERRDAVLAARALSRG